MSGGSRDYIFNTEIDNQGRSTVHIIDRNSENTGHHISGGISRFFTSIKTTAKMNANLGWSTSDYLLNGVMDKHYSHNRSGTFELISHVSAHLAVDYRVTSGQSLGRLSMGKRTNTVYQTHYLNLTVTANGPHTFFVQNFLYHHNIPQQRDQYFIDLNYRYTMKKWKTDLVLTGTNLLNNKEYVQQFSNDIELVQSYFELRPRQFILSTTFRF